MSPKSRLFGASAAFVIVLFAGPFVTSARADVTVPGNYSSIQAAINAVLSGAQPDGTTILVQPGTYNEALQVVQTGRSVTVRGVGGPGVTIVNALNLGAPALLVRNASGRVEFRGLTFRNGARGGQLEGGGFEIRGSSPTLTDVVFESSTAYRGGGGVLNASHPTFVRCTIRNNTSRHFGGGIYIVGGSRPTFTACDITGNASGTGGAGEGNNGAGGGVFSHDSSPTFRGGRISNNTSRFAGAGLFQMGVFGSPNGRAVIRVEDAEIADNVSSQFPGEPNPSEGGGVHVEDFASGEIVRTRVLRNRAGTGGGLNAYRARYDIVDSTIGSNVATAGFGGGISTSNNFATPSMPATTINLTSSLVRNNTAPMGAGIAVVGDNFSNEHGVLAISGSVVSGNQSQSQGGGILASKTFLTTVNSLIMNNVVSGGSPAYGGGIFMINGSGANITSTAISHNTAGAFGGGFYIGDGTSISMSGSQVYDNSTSVYGAGIYTGPGATGSVQSSIIADNGGSQSNAQVVEDGGGCSAVSYPNNVMTTPPFGGCSSLSSRAPGTNTSSPPRFVKFLAVPSAGAASTLAWSVGRATSVTIAGVGTFNQDTGSVDVAPSSSTTYTLTAAASSANGGAYGPVGVNFTVVAPPTGVTRTVDGDFNGDGKTDLAVYRPANGGWYLWHLGVGTSSYGWGNQSDKPVAGDFDGDRRADIAVFRPANGTWYVWFSSTGSTAGYPWGNMVDTPVPGDYDADGKTDLAVYRPSNGGWYLQLSSSGAMPSYGWGNSTDRPVPGDYNGDGRTDIGIYRPSDGMWWVYYTNTGAIQSWHWGAPADKPVPGDYDGDGRTDVAVYRPANGTWFIWNSSTGTTTGTAWGNSTDVPVPGDYDGDGRTDLAVFRPSAGAWYIWFSSTGSTGAFGWGNSADAPILKRPL
jgi:hypothetical protein